jgi:hypothetical protein
MPILRNRTRPTPIAAPAEGPPPERVAFQADATASSPAELKAAAMRAARAFFAGCDVTTLEAESGWKACRASGGYQAEITIWGVIGGPESRCPACFAMVSAIPGEPVLAQHDHPRSSWACPGSGTPDYARMPAGRRQEMRAEQESLLERDEKAYQAEFRRADHRAGGEYTLQERLRQRRDLLREWAVPEAPGAGREGRAAA